MSPQTTEKIVTTKTLALVGNPNVGKSVVFNRLTGKYVAVSNYPGTTVDISRGVGTFSSEPWQVLDTPGVNSLIPFSEDERVTRDVLLKERPDVVVNVLDAKNLRRGLRVTLELLEHGLPLVLVLNLTDEALDRGITVDAARLSKRFGVPVVATVATTGDGIPELKRAVGRAAVSSLRVPYPSETADALSEMENLWRSDVPSRRALGASLLAGDAGVLAWGSAGFRSGVTEREANERAEAKRAVFARDPRQLLFDARESLVREIEAEVLRREGQISSSWATWLGLAAMRPWPGYLIAAAVLYLTYLFVGNFGAGTAVDFLENTLFGAYLVPAVSTLVKAFIPSVFIQDILVGEYGVVSMALTYAFALILPIVSTFFLAFGVLEDSGYLPRLSVILDRVFRLMGLNGRAVLPMVLGLGCDTMAVVTTRILDTKKERIVVSLLLALTVPCSAQLAVILGMTAGLSPRVLMIWLTILISLTLVTGWAASKFIPGSRSNFLMEIPPVRRPLLRNIALKMKSRLTWYMKEVVPLFVYGTLGLFFLDRWGVLQWLERWGAPVVKGLLGLPAEATEAFLVGFLRRDYGAAGFYKLQKEGLLNLRQVTVSLVLITLFMPCIAQWLMTIKERGIKWAALITGIVMVVALSIAAALNVFLETFPGILGG
jgi:ferrous iron transport protein B